MRTYTKAEKKRKPNPGEVWLFDDHIYALIVEHNIISVAVCLGTHGMAAGFFIGDLPLKHFIATSPEEYFRKKFNGELSKERNEG